MLAEYTCITPVAIGGGDPPLSPYSDYYIDESEIVILNQKEFAAFLMHDKATYSRFKASLLNKDENNRLGFDLKQFIKNHDSNSLGILTKHRIPQIGFVDGDKIEINNLLRTKGSPYISGSSVKGALKTAFLYNTLIENDSASLKPFINKINVTYNNASAVITKLKNERFAEKPDNALIHQYKMQLSNIIKNPIIDYFEVEYENAFFGNDYAAKFIFNQLKSF